MGLFVMNKIIRRKHNESYVTIDKTCLNDVSLSWQAKGLHSYLMGLPDDWNIYTSDLSKRAKNGRDSVLGILNELIEKGYMTRTVLRNQQGKTCGTEYVVYELPLSGEVSQSLGNKGINPQPGNPDTANPTLINNNITNKPLNKKITATTDKADQVTSGEEKSSLNPAAAFSSCSVAEEQAVEAVIGHRLTAKQLAVVAKLADTLNSALPKLGVLPEDLTKSLLDPKCYSKAGRDFHKKVNTLRAQALRGQWRPSSKIDLASKACDEQTTVIKTLRSKIQDLTLNRSSLLSSLRSPMAKYDSTFLATQKQRLVELEQRISGMSSELSAMLGNSVEGLPC